MSGMFGGNPSKKQKGKPPEKTTEDIFSFCDKKQRNILWCKCKVCKWITFSIKVEKYKDEKGVAKERILCNRCGFPHISFHRLKFGIILLLLIFLCFITILIQTGICDFRRSIENLDYIPSGVIFDHTINNEKNYFRTKQEGYYFFEVENKYDEPLGIEISTSKVAMGFETLNKNEKKATAVYLEKHSLVCIQIIDPINDHIHLKVEIYSKKDNEKKGELVEEYDNRRHAHKEYEDLLNEGTFVLSKVDSLYVERNKNSESVSFECGKKYYVKKFENKNYDEILNIDENGYWIPLSDQNNGEESECYWYYKRFS